MQKPLDNILSIGQK